MKKTLILLATFTLILSANAQSKQKIDATAIKSMCGCFEVTFNFIETFQHSDDSLYLPSEPKVASALEWAQLVVDEKDEVSIQHILQMGDATDAYVIKHWRQDWLYEYKNFYMFNGDNSWIFQEKSSSDVKGQWTQKVYQVDDSPRYEGSATWVHVDGKSFWENSTDAPLPRREYTQRSDYNVTVRGNRQEITDIGWVHDQDNDKVIREANKEDVLIAQEKGYNIYKKVDDSRCSAAAQWWTTNYEKWNIVREKWNEIYARNVNLNLKVKVDNKALYKHLFSDDCKEKEQINDVIESFVIR